MTEGCFVCGKHVHLDDLPGGAILADEHVVVSHLPLVTPRGEADDVLLGHLMVEPRRHVAELGELDPHEAGSFGRLTARASAALQSVTNAEHVYAAVIGHGVEHLHLHLVPRLPGTPREYWWPRVDEWPEAPRGGPDLVGALAERLRAALLT
jgi:diadenosine tetraphosphate (Ap4A) HIT family hydrolase